MRIQTLLVVLLATRPAFAMDLCAVGSTGNCLNRRLGSSADEDADKGRSADEGSSADSNQAAQNAALQAQYQNEALQTQQMQQTQPMQAPQQVVGTVHKFELTGVTPQMFQANEPMFEDAYFETVKQHFQQQGSLLQQGSFQVRSNLDQTQPRSGGVLVDFDLQFLRQSDSDMMSREGGVRSANFASNLSQHIKQRTGLDVVATVTEVTGSILGDAADLAKRAASGDLDLPAMAGIAQRVVAGGGVQSLGVADAASNVASQAITAAATAVASPTDADQCTCATRGYNPLNCGTCPQNCHMVSGATVYWCKKCPAGTVTCNEKGDMDTTGTATKCCNWN